ncbi:MAG: radical SAM protein [Deltaproteobacteria bacterium RIFOXYD12_FULL_57_12]|nr:MAG: radical SAM protein [Deltaproteobacteria bacterium RIFOXYD12_FULL_57_12]
MTATTDGFTLPESFRQTLARHAITLTRDETRILQINVGLLCNLSCRHCHLEAGPHCHQEMMTPETIDLVTAAARHHRFSLIDITGGAPEMHPRINEIIERLAPLAPTVILRSNLTAIAEHGRDSLLEQCRDRRIVIAASFPSLDESQADAQRGRGVFHKSIATLQKLNGLGYGQPDSNLELNLVANPAGAFLPTGQAELEKRFRRVLAQKWDIVFNNLYTFANVPLGRFHNWLVKSGNLEGYMRKLAAGFNPCATKGLMCRSLISVAWDGYLYDCDFNQAVDLPMSGRRTHISELRELPAPGSEIAVADHCFTCTAGAGFT